MEEASDEDKDEDSGADSDEDGEAALAKQYQKEVAEDSSSEEEGDDLDPEKKKIAKDKVHFRICFIWGILLGKTQIRTLPFSLFFVYFNSLRMITLLLTKCATFAYIVKLLLFNNHCKLYCVYELLTTANF